MKKHTLSQQVIKGSFYNFLTTLVSRGGALIFTFFIARLLLPEGFGLYSLALAAVFLLQSLIDLGTNSALLRYITQYASQKEKAQAYFKAIFKIKILLTIVAILILVILAYPVTFFVFKQPKLFILFLLAPFYLALLSFESFYTSLFYIFNEVKFVLWKELLSQTLRIAFISLVPLLIVKFFYVPATFLVLIVSLLLICSSIFILAMRRYSFLFNSHTTINIDYKELRRFIWFVSFGGLSAMFFSSIDTFFIGVLIHDASYVGFYRAAATLVFSVAGTLTFTNVFLPRLAQIQKRNLQHAWDRLMRYALLLTIPSAIGLVVLGRYVIRAVYGYAFLDAVIPLYILSPITIEAVLSGIIYSVLSARGHPESYTKASTITLFLSFVLTPLFIYLFLPVSMLAATTAAATAILICRIFYMLFLFNSAQKELHLKIVKSAFIFKPVFSAACMGIVLLILNKFFISDMTWLLGFAEVIFGALFYFLILYLLKGINNDDIKLVSPKNVI